MYCQNCGNNIKEENSVFCSKCGNKLNSTNDNSVDDSQKQTGEISNTGTHKKNVASSSRLKNISIFIFVTVMVYIFMPERVVGGSFGEMIYINSQSLLAYLLVALLFSGIIFTIRKKKKHPGKSRFFPTFIITYIIVTVFLFIVGYSQ